MCKRGEELKIWMTGTTQTTPGMIMHLMQVSIGFSKFAISFFGTASEIRSPIACWQPAQMPVLLPYLGTPEKMSGFKKVQIAICILAAVFCSFLNMLKVF